MQAHHTSNRDCQATCDRSVKPVDDRTADFGLLGLELLLYGLQSPINIGMILRIAEAFRFRVTLFDRHGVLNDPDKRSTVHDFSCGAQSRSDLQILDDPSSLIQSRSGRRVVATSIVPSAQPLSQFHFLPGDVLVLGNEYDGLPEQMIAAAHVLLKVSTPQVWMPKERSHRPIDVSRTAPVARDGEPSLNVAVTAGILCYAAYQQWLASEIANDE
jgi:tRNA G18 (ribose-2'-O)-methylase SpoU